ncbi:MAG: ROK family protein [Acidobacteria bacterium]|jgi:glucokinase|nr:MAG: ROK family protein [Acidobacteriota bacterium]
MKKGVDIGGSFIKVYWEDGRTEKHYIRHIVEHKELFLNKVREIVLDGDPSQVGVAVAGFTSLDGVVYKSPNIRALDSVNLSELLTDVRAKIVNDVSAGAYGEWFYSHRESRVLLFIAVGTGLGAGLVIGGKPFLGACGSSLEAGHHTIVKGGELCSCGRCGCWEAYCSSYGLERLYHRLSEQRLSDFEIVKRAYEGDGVALRSVEEFKSYLLLGLMNMVHLFNPDRVVLGGGLIDALKGMLGDIEARLKAVCEKLPAECLGVHLSDCAEYCMARGALAMVLEDDI